jgi:two-component system, OmpR family, sensor kinase
MRPPSIRARLALWYGAALALSLALFAAVGFAFVARTSLASTDASLGEALDAVESALDLEASERRVPESDLGPIVQDFRFRDLKVAILDRGTARVYLGADSAAIGAADSATVTPGAALARAHVPLEAPDMRLLLQRASRTSEQISTVTAGSESVRLMVRPYHSGQHVLVIGAAHGLRGRDRMLHQLALALAGGIPLLLIAATAGGWLLARQSLHPVAEMTERAATIGATTLHERLPVKNSRDELGRLAIVFNDLLGRLDQAFEQQRQFMADASHELRTPVTIMSGEAELALSRQDRPQEELRAALVIIRHEAQRLKRIVDDLFLLARANAGEELRAPAALYLGDLARECVQAARSLAAAKRITLRYEGEEELPYTGDEALLRRLVMNLLDNAIKFTPPGGMVLLSATSGEEEYTLEVRDSGPGIPSAARARLFDRFYRVRREPPAEPGADGDGNGGGAGLGLAIARWIAESHGGAIALTRSDQHGSTFRVQLPAGGVTESTTPRG